MMPPAPTTPRKGGLKTPRGSSVTTSRLSDVEAIEKQLRRVQFSDDKGLELERTQRTTSTHHPTPFEAKQVIHNTSKRRLEIDEVELIYSEETRFPPSQNDYVVRKFVGRNDVILGGRFECQEDLKVVMIKTAKFKMYWGELYNGVLVLYRYKDGVEKKREVVPIHKAEFRIVDVTDRVLEIHYLYQNHRQTKVLKFDARADLFLWWWALQLASVDRDERTFYHTMKSQNASAPLQLLLQNSAYVENVVFPRPVRAPSSRRLADKVCITHLILVRHGETENMHFRVSDKEKGLTKRGREQAALTATHIANFLMENGADGENVQLLYGGLQRTLDTAKEFERVMPWIKHTNECCLLEEGAPKSIDDTHRMEFRATMHRMAYEHVCRSDYSDPFRSTATNTYECYKILICHTSFVQHCIAQSYGISKEVVKIGAPISHGSITKIDIHKDGDATEQMHVDYSNRVTHLPLTHRTSE